jgi:hypothetical protein
LREVIPTIPVERAKGKPLSVAKEVPEGIQSQDDLFAKYRVALPALCHPPLKNFEPYPIVPNEQPTPK